MGSGKSRVGRLLAARLGWEFIDLDDEVERRTGLRIDQIFLQQGEAAFRRLELSALRNLPTGNELVIALGGGTPTQEAVWEILRSGFVIYLRCTAQELFRRLQDDEQRPLLQATSKERRLLHIQELLRARESHYNKANMIIDSLAENSPTDTAEIICRELYLLRIVEGLEE